MQGGTAREACADMPFAGFVVELDVHERRPKPVVLVYQPDAVGSGVPVHLMARGDCRMGLQEEATTGPASSPNAWEAYHVGREWMVGCLRNSHCVRGPVPRG